jgi:hypothetical protein
MIKHVNFTGRRRIPRECIGIVVHAGSPRTFDASIDLQRLPLPGTARVYLEAMCAGASVVQRFAFGTVDRPAPPPRRLLDEIDGERVFFALKVVDESQCIGRILGLAEGIQPTQADKALDAGRRGILPIVPANLGQELWRIGFEEQEVYLYVNETIPGFKERMRWDPMLQGAVYPEALRTVLTEAVERGASEDDDRDTWPARWIRFAQRLHPEGAAVPQNDHNEQKEWIDTVVAEFATKHEFASRIVKELEQREECDGP